MPYSTHQGNTKPLALLSNRCIRCAHLVGFHLQPWSLRLVPLCKARRAVLSGWVLPGTVGGDRDTGRRLLRRLRGARRSSNSAGEQQRCGCSSLLAERGHLLIPSRCCAAASQLHAAGAAVATRRCSSLLREGCPASFRVAGALLSRHAAPSAPARPTTQRFYGHCSSAIPCVSPPTPTVSGAAPPIPPPLPVPQLAGVL